MQRYIDTLMCNDNRIQLSWEAMKTCNVRILHMYKDNDLHQHFQQYMVVVKAFHANI
jgi:hypothetical protein